MERYSEYKDSGVQWLGEIPEHWKQFQFRKFFKIKKDIAGKEGFDVIILGDIDHFKKINDKYDMSNELKKYYCEAFRLRQCTLKGTLRSHEVLRYSVLL